MNVAPDVVVTHNVPRTSRLWAVVVLALAVVVGAGLSASWTRGDGWKGAYSQAQRNVDIVTAQNQQLQAQVRDQGDEITCRSQASLEVGKATDAATAAANQLQSITGHLVAALANTGKATADGDVAAMAAARADVDNWLAQFGPASDALDQAQAAVATARAKQERALTECATTPTTTEEP